MTDSSLYLSSGSSVLCIIGGTVGYIRKKSIPSLIAGIGIGSLFAISAWMISKKDANGLKVYGTVSGILAAGMIPRAIKTRKPVPIALGASGLVMVCDSLLSSMRERTEPEITSREQNNLKNIS